MHLQIRLTGFSLIEDGIAIIVGSAPAFVRFLHLYVSDTSFGRFVRESTSRKSFANHGHAFLSPRPLSGHFRNTSQPSNRSIGSGGIKLSEEQTQETDTETHELVDAFPMIKPKSAHLANTYTHNARVYKSEVQASTEELVRHGS
jgi:hypothetical protein